MSEVKLEVKALCICIGIAESVVQMKAIKKNAKRKDWKQCALAYMRLYLCLSLREREREGGGEREREREKKESARGAARSKAA